MNMVITKKALNPNAEIRFVPCKIKRNVAQDRLDAVVSYAKAYTAKTWDHLMVSKRYDACCGVAKGEQTAMLRSSWCDCDALTNNLKNIAQGKDPFIKIDSKYYEEA